MWQAFKILLRCLFINFEPATRAATFCSSRTFQFTNSSISGWSKSSVTIFAARLVVPPDFIAPALLSPILRKDIKPEDFPPPLSGSPEPRMFEKFVPVPDPYLNNLASLTHKSIIPPSFTKSSLTD